MTPVESALSLAQAGVFFALLFAAAASDLRGRRIAPEIWGGGILAGMFFAFIRGGWWQTAPGSVSLGASLLAALTAFAIYFAAYLAGGLGAGDVKLIAAVGALSNVAFVLWVILFAALAGAALAVALLIRRGQLADGLARSARAMVRLRAPRPKTDEAPVKENEKKHADGMETQGAPKSGMDEDEGESGGGTLDADGAEAPERLTIPYGVAICAGGIWAAIHFASSLRPLPFG